MTEDTDLDWTTFLAEQLAWHWESFLRPKLDGLTDREYLWEPAPGCWSIRPHGEAVTAMAAGAGRFVADFEVPVPEPAPVTTTAWRIAHLVVGVFGARNAAHFGGPPCDYGTWAYAGTAGEALNQLDEAYAGWIRGVRSLDAVGLRRAVGEAEGPWAASPYAELVLHINREALHHGAELLLLRDLYRHAHDRIDATG